MLLRNFPEAGIRAGAQHFATLDDCSADFSAVQFPAFADAAFLCLGCKPFVSKLRKPPKRSSKLVISRQDQTALL